VKRLAPARLQFEHISPERICCSPNDGLPFEVRDPVQMYAPLFNKEQIEDVHVYVPFDDNENLKGSNSSIEVTLAGAAIPGSPFRPAYRPATPFVEAWARAFRMRTPYSYTVAADARPAVIWTWNYFPDAYNNTQFYVEGVVEDVEMSPVVLVHDFSGLVRAPALPFGTHFALVLLQTSLDAHAPARCLPRSPDPLQSRARRAWLAAHRACLRARPPRWSVT
jgi:hypothetical protein